MQIREGMEQKYERFIAAHNWNAHEQAGVKLIKIWSGMMEKVMEHGLTVAEAAEITLDAADLAVGASCSLHVAACAALQQYWVHGDALKAWYRQNHAWEQEEVEAWLQQEDARQMQALKNRPVDDRDGPVSGMQMYP